MPGLKDPGPSATTGRLREVRDSGIRPFDADHDDPADRIDLTSAAALNTLIEAAAVRDRQVERAMGWRARRARVAHRLKLARRESGT